MSTAGPEHVVLILAPIGGDARNISEVLRKAGHLPKICRPPIDMAAELRKDFGAIVATEEALTPELLGILGGIFQSQPPWSDIPIVLISASSPKNFGPAMADRLRGPRRTITLLDRPLRSATLLTTLDTLLAARKRQYEIRGLLDERDGLLSSLEIRVAQRTAELRRMVEEMEAFSYSVSHDLRSPLRSLAGYAEALQEDYGGELSPGARSYCEKIVRAARRMDNLTQDVLAYTRVTQCEMEIVPVDLDPLLAGVIEQYPALISEAARIRVERPLGWVKGHGASLIQCFSNLLGNAIKFVPPGREPFIEIRAQRMGGLRRVIVKDNGVGIAGEDQARIFGMFERASEKGVPGTGIGLAIVKKAVERMGGTVGVMSQVGIGSEFWVELSAVDAPSAFIDVPQSTSPFWSEMELARPAAVT